MDTDDIMKGTQLPETGSIAEPENSIFSDILNEIVSSPLNLILVLAIGFLIYKIFKGRRGAAHERETSSPPPLPKLKKRDVSLHELSQYDGSDTTGRILVAVNGKVFDVTRGKRFYGPGGPYSSFAGHDASRALAMFQTDLVKDEYDDLSDLNSMQMESVKEWEAQLAEKYDFVGKLLRPGEEPSNYSEDEESEQKGDDDNEKSKSD